jgi:hypothetical protein
LSITARKLLSHGCGCASKIFLSEGTVGAWGYLQHELAFSVFRPLEVIDVLFTCAFVFQLGQEQLRLFLERGIAAHAPYGTFILDHAFEGV